MKYQTFKMDDITDDIDKVVDLLNVLKSRYFFLRAKYDVGKVLMFYIL